MIDILPNVAAALSDIGRVELQFPDVSADFPVITVAEIANVADTVLDNADRLSDVTVQVDVWDNGDTPETVIDMAEKANNKLTALGLRRVSAQLFPDASGLQRKTMRFRGLIDEVSGRVYN